LEPGNEQNCTQGIRIEVRQGDREEGNISFLDHDEVDSLLAGLQYMSGCIAQWQGYRGDYLEMIFSTRGDFSVGFYMDNGTIQAFAKSAYQQVFIAVGVVTQLAGLLRSGQEQLATTPVGTLPPIGQWY